MVEPGEICNTRAVSGLNQYFPPEIKQGARASPDRLTEALSPVAQNEVPRPSPVAGEKQASPGTSVMTKTVKPDPPNGSV